MWMIEWWFFYLLKTTPAPARFHRVASKNPNLRSLPASEIFFLRCQNIPQPSEILPQPWKILPQPLEIIPQLQETLPQLLEMRPQVIEMVPQLSEMVPQLSEMIKQYCDAISIIDNLCNSMIIYYICI